MPQLKGNIPWNKNKKGLQVAWNKGLKFLQISGDKHWNWKGDKVGYYGVHDWIEKELGKPNYCSNCGSLKAKKFEWSNISSLYKRDITDWIRLCTSCHRYFDGHGYKMWEIRRKYA
jgi:hypothetical protein